jgi:hypothetical protein
MILWDGSSPQAYASLSFFNKTCQGLSPYYCAKDDVRGEYQHGSAELVVLRDLEAGALEDDVAGSLDLNQATFTAMRIQGVRVMSRIVFTCESVLSEKSDSCAENRPGGVCNSQHEVRGLA